jgi:ACS family tartrate transporter-like MFS transporter
MVTATDSSLAQRTRRRVDRRLLPFIFLLYIVSYLDRVNAGSAGLQMTRDLHMSDANFGFGSGIFFLGYSLLEIPGGILAEVWSARKWIARILISWGLLASVTGLIHNAHQFYWIRFLLGMAEAGFVPGILVYLSHWYRPEDRGRAIATFFAGIPASQALGGPLAAVLLRLHWLGMPGWRWLLMLEGIPGLLLGVMAIFYLTEKPADAEWLRPEEREFLASELKKEQASRHSSDSILKALGNPHVLLLCAILFMALNSTYGVSIWLPKMVQKLSAFDVSKVSLIAAIPSLCSLPMMILVGWSSDRMGERIWHAAIPRFLSGASLLVCFFSTVSGHIWLSVAMLSLATIGFYCGHAGFWPLPNMFLGRTAAAASIGLINSFGSLGGFLGNWMIGKLSDQSGSYGPGLLYFSACSFTSAVLVLRVRGALRKVEASRRNSA